MRDRARRLLALREGFGLRSRGGGSSSSISSGSGLGAAFFGFACSAAGMRSSGDNRNAASEGSPNCGSLRPPFFLPHAIVNAARTTPRGTLAGGV